MRLPSFPLSGGRGEDPTPSPEPPPSPPVLRAPRPLSHIQLPNNPPTTDPLTAAVLRAGDAAQRRRGIRPRTAIANNDVNGEERPPTPDLVSDHGSMSSTRTRLSSMSTSTTLVHNSLELPPAVLSFHLERSDAPSPPSEPQVPDPPILSLHSHDSVTSSNNTLQTHTTPTYLRQLRAMVPAPARFRTLLRRVAHRVPSPSLSPLLPRSPHSSTRSSGLSSSSSSSSSSLNQLQRFRGLTSRLRARFLRARR